MIIRAMQPGVRIFPLAIDKRMPDGYNRAQKIKKVHQTGAPKAFNF